MHTFSRLILAAVLCAGATPGFVQTQPSAQGKRYEVNSLDREQPVYADGRAIVKTIAAEDGLCWGNPSIDGQVVTSEFGKYRSHGSSPHAGVDFRAYAGSPIYAVADGCVSFGNPTPRQLIGVKQRINDKFPNSTVWYLHMSRVVPKFINDGRSGACVPIRKGEIIGYSGNYYGSNGSEGASGDAHLHLSYFVSGLQLNPVPYQGAPGTIPSEFNTIKSSSAISTGITGGGGGRDSDASGTKGSTLGFAVPRMCSVFVVKDSGKKTIPFDGNFGVGSYSANATSPTKTELEDGQQRVRQSMGLDAAGRGGSAPIDATHWSGGMPEEPDWDSYAEMSFEQIIRAEVSRRSGNPRWAEQLMEQSERGLMTERAWIKALRLKLRVEASQSAQRSEAMLASLLATRARRLADAQQSGLPSDRRQLVR